MATIEPQTGRQEAGADIEKSHAIDNGVREVDEKNTSDVDSEVFQPGVQRVRAITSVWTKKTMIIMFCLLYLVSFVDALLQSVQGNLNAFITSSFSKHGLLAIVSIFATMLSGCCQLVIAKVIDIWGRSEGFGILMLFTLLGMILKATCQNMEAYVAGHTIYYVGHFGMVFVIDVMLADMTSLKNRMIMFGINGTPTIAVTFAGPRIAELFYTYSNFRWAFAAFAIILVGLCAPALLVMFLMQRKAEKAGLLEKTRVTSDRNYWQGFWYYFIQFDMIGIILLCAFFVLLLLPFSIISYAPNGWKSGHIIAMLVISVLCVPALYIWEKKFTPVPFIKYKYLKERTIIGSCLLYGIMFLSIFTWDAYYQSYLLVVHRQSITHAGYILNAFSLTSSFFGPLYGLLIRWTGDFKYTGLAGVPFVLLGTALLIPYRSPSAPVGVLVVLQMLNGVGTGIWAACGQISIMAVTSHQEIASVMAIWGLFGSIGATVGYAIAGGLWNNIMPSSLYNNLPDDAKNRTAEIFGSVEIQMSFLDGDPIRDAIVASYADVQHKMVITGACFIPLCLACVLAWKRINIKKLEEEKGTQTKGEVF
ncbi:Siderophore iron transporter mirB [Colletotrichum tanaceti]|uniref:Siderophore iron transporter mirB n=1 Tax=Colletotrichum tanaceti TaxID=1306861 RepID=A0A4U6XI27_9PEZI|nr:Siderophore iron transporter mirB [Colletotrichum tanaceti]TKW55608.1 Siderophore iron transporter mirB [Colletotrichum tanaceti]